MSESVDVSKNLEDQIKKLEAELKFRKERITKLEKELASTKSTSMKYERKINDLNKKIDISTVENVDLKKQIADLEENIKQLGTEALEAELKESKELITTQNQKIKELNDKNTIHSNELSKIRLKIKENESSLELKQKEINSLNKNLEKSETIIKTNEETINSLNSTIEKLKKDLEESRILMKDQTNKLDENLSKMREAIDNLKSAQHLLQKKDKTITDLKNKIIDLKNEEKKSEERMKELQLNYDKKDIETQELNTKITDLEKTLENKNEDIKIKTRKVEELTKNIDIIEVGVDLYRNTIKEIKLELKKRSNQLRELKSKKEVTIDENKYVKMLEIKDKTISILKREISDLNAKLEVLKSPKGANETIPLEDKEPHIKEIMESIKEKLPEDEYKKLILIFKEKDTQLKEIQSLSKKQKSKLKKSGKAADIKTYESYIVTLQTELSDVKHQLETSEQLRTEQQQHVDRLEVLIAQIQAQMDQPQLASTYGISIDTSDPLQEPPILKDHVEDLSGPSNDDSGLLSNRSLTIEEKIEQDRNNQLMEFYSELTKRFQGITDIAFAGFDGVIYLQTTPWDIKSDIFKLIQNWKAEAPAVWINKLKYATIKATPDTLIATNVQGKGHLLCATVDKQLFMICYIDIKGDALIFYEEFKELLPRVKTIFKNYEKRKTELL